MPPPLWLAGTVPHVFCRARSGSGCSRSCLQSDPALYLLETSTWGRWNWIVPCRAAADRHPCLHYIMQASMLLLLLLLLQLFLVLLQHTSWKQACKAVSLCGRGGSASVMPPWGAAASLLTTTALCSADLNLFKFFKSSLHLPWFASLSLLSLYLSCYFSIRSLFVKTEAKKTLGSSTYFASSIFTLVSLLFFFFHLTNLYTPFLLPLSFLASYNFYCTLSCWFCPYMFVLFLCKAILCIASPGPCHMYLLIFQVTKELPM